MSEFKIGDIVIPREGLTWGHAPRRPIPPVPHVVRAIRDLRRRGMGVYLTIGLDPDSATARAIEHPTVREMVTRWGYAVRAGDVERKEPSVMRGTEGSSLQLRASKAPPSE